MGDAPKNGYLTIEGGIDGEARFLLKRMFENSNAPPREVFSQMVRERAKVVLGERDYVWALEDYDDNQDRKERRQAEALIKLDEPKSP